MRGRGDTSTVPVSGIIDIWGGREEPCIPQPHVKEKGRQNKSLEASGGEKALQSSQWVWGSPCTGGGGCE